MSSTPLASPAAVQHGATQTGASRAYAHYVLALLVLVYVVNFVDRSILTILQESIRREMQLSDTQLGFLGGVSFALLYATVGIPVARWADRGSRRTIMALGLLLWSTMTVLCGFSRTFWQLALARVGVGLGESACSPPAHSLISDYFPPERRATALAIYSTGIPLGTGLGQLVGGWASDLFDWRTAFVVVGLPGIALAGVVLTTIREPQRGGLDPGHGAPGSHGAPAESVGAVLSFLWSLRSFRHLSLAAGLHALYGYAWNAFSASFFERVHGLSRSEIGGYLGLIAIVFGTLSVFVGGRTGDWLARRGDSRWFLWVPAIATGAGIPFAMGLYLSPSPYLALTFLVPYVLLANMYLAPTFAMTQALVPPRMRATAAAIMLFVINMIGLALGPQLTGILSDTLRSMGVEASLRWALFTVVCLGAAWSTLHYTLGAIPLRADLAAQRRLAGPA